MPIRTIITGALILFVAGFAAAQSALEGRITAKQGRPIADAVIALKHNGTEYTHSTDADGKFRFANIQPGEYEITASAAGFYSAEYEFAVRPRQPLMVEMELTPRGVVKQEIEVRSADISMSETGSSRLLTHSELAEIPTPLKRNIPTLALSTFPGATRPFFIFFRIEQGRGAARICRQARHIHRAGLHLDIAIAGNPLCPGGRNS